MEYFLIIVIPITIWIVEFGVLRRFNKDGRAQRALDKYLKKNLSPQEIGTFYERYIGHLYETKGYDVIYNGAIHGFKDMGRDLIVSNADEVLLIQTKCWAKGKLVREKHIFQLYGSTMHFRRTAGGSGRRVRAVFYTTASFGHVARQAARTLAVEIRSENLDRSYPMIKCHVSSNGEKVYLLPFDPSYDQVKVDLRKNEYFAHSVQDAVERGFRRAS